MILGPGEKLALGLFVERDGKLYQSGHTDLADPLPTGVSVAWASPDERIATVDSSNTLTAVAPGHVVLRGFAAGAADSFSLVVRGATAATRSFVSVAGGGSHVCALGVDRMVYCWGNDWSGQLGSGVLRKYTVTAAPNRVVVLRSAQAISAGTNHTCALDDFGVVWCWGDGRFGQVKPGTSGVYATPVSISLAETVIAVSAGGDHTCAMGVTGRIACWGRGTGAFAWLQSPGERFVEVSSGYNHSCAVDNVGRAYCWGNNDEGQLGLGDRMGRSLPTPIRSNERYRAVSAGTRYTCGVTAPGEGRCWGLGDGGILGSGEFLSTSVPTAVRNVGDFVQISAGTRHTCGVVASGAAYCWGLDDRGQLGDGGSTTPFPILSDLIRPEPVRVMSDVLFSRISAASGDHSCAVSRLATLYCWGNNARGAIGIGRLGGVEAWQPTSIESTEPVRSVP
ncbi:MAG: hypothetical protein IT359_07145 [Gemmatimonadaceae bacterium]|nr:hypothetical protein [Gemmatimonadaceae bacterium]